MSSLGNVCVWLTRSQLACRPDRHEPERAGGVGRVRQPAPRRHRALFPRARSGQLAAGASLSPPKRLDNLPTNPQCLSSITEFPNLVATIQTMKHLNPLQVRPPSRRPRVRALPDMLYARPPARPPDAPRRARLQVRSQRGPHDGRVLPVPRAAPKRLGAAPRQARGRGPPQRGASTLAPSLDLS